MSLPPPLARLLDAAARLRAEGIAALPGWLAWEAPGSPPAPQPGLPGEAELLLRAADGERALLLWTPPGEAPGPILVRDRDGALDLVAGSPEELVQLVLAAGDLARELPRDARELRHLAAAVEPDARAALERLRQGLALPAPDLDALGARLAAAQAAQGALLAPVEPPLPACSPADWPDAPVPRGVPRLTAAFRPATPLTVAVLLQHEGRLVRLEGRSAVSELVHVGPLALPSGRLLVGDLLGQGQAAAAELELAPGSWPVFLSLARFPGGGARVAAALVLLDPAPPARWEQGPGLASASGAVALLDASGLPAWRAEPAQQQARLRRALRRGQSGAVGWARLGVAGGPELLACTSGWGDGTYRTWVGRDAAGRVRAVAASFGVLAGDAPEAGGGPPPAATPSAEDERLVAALAALPAPSPVRRAWIADVRRQVEALGQALSPEQRRRARELLDEG